MSFSDRHGADLLKHDQRVVAAMDKQRFSAASVWKTGSSVDLLSGIGGCYLLHFHGAIAGHARHYLGYASDIAARIECHRSGNGARLMRAVKLEGIEFEVARVWPGLDRNGERALKRQRNHARLCPICRAACKG